MGKFGMHARFRGSFDEAVEKVTDALKREGFGVLTEIDVQATLKKKLDVDFRRYKILGACNPPFAHRALQESLDVGLLLPCNVTVYEEDGGGATHVAAIDPMETIAAQSGPGLMQVAREVHEKLERVIARVGERSEGRTSVLRASLFVLLGGGLGFAWHRFVGCRSGACPIWASPYASTLYGALLGFLLSR